jgi:hypothetical protein
MAEDYYLKQTYSKLSDDSRYKSNYKTLSESYSSVYESDRTTSFVPSKINELMLDIQRWTLPQQSLYRLTASKIKPKNKQQELLPSEIETNAEAEADLVAAKEGIPTGLGPGEYAVASVVSDSNDPTELVNLISGQGMSYDVSWPSSDPELAKYKFEVKLEGEVRIGAKGADIGNRIRETVKSVLTQIQEEYSLLKGEERKRADAAILDRITLKRITPHIPTKKKRGDGETSDSIKQRLKHEAEVATREAKKAGWTVEGYIHSILSNLNELPLPLINGTEYEYANYNVKTDTDVSRNKYLITSLLSFLKAIDAFHGVVNVNRWGREEADTRSVSAIKNVFQKYYGVKDDDKAPEINKVIDDEAHKIDRKLSRTKHTVTGEGIATYSDFFKAIKKLHLTKEIEDIGKHVLSDKAIRSCFPDDLTGLFVVNEIGYRYVPANKLGECLKITKISQGNPKVVLKKPNE